MKQFSSGKKAGEAGFTLIEVLTAMVILAIAMVTILELFSGGLRNVGLSDRYTRGVFHAREKMDSLLLYDQLRDAELTGAFEDGYEWQADIAWVDPAAEAAEASFGDEKPPAPSPLDLFKITVIVRWRDEDREREVEISTLHIARKLADEVVE